MTKKQHYIPQFYLRQWIDCDGGFYPAKVEQKIPPKIKVFKDKSGPVGFCFENFFYAQHTGKEDEISQEIETKFAEIEGVFSSKLPELEKKIFEYKQITKEDIFHLSEFMIFLWIKGKKYREQSQKMSEEMFKQVNKRLAYFSDRDPKTKAKMDELGLTKEELIDFTEKGEYTVDFGNMHHLSLLKDMYGFCNLLSAKNWKVYISKNGDFLTTDAPYQDKALNNHFWGNDYFSREQSFILSPRVMIVTMPKIEGNKKLVRKDITDNINMIRQINMTNLMNSIKFGFHKNKDILEKTAELATVYYQYRNGQVVNNRDIVKKVIKKIIK